MRKWLAWIIAVTLVFSFLAMPVLAEEDAPEEDAVTEIPEEEFSEENEGVVELAEEGGELPEDDEDEDEEAFIPEELDKTIFGSDDRVNVKASSYPYSAIAYMVVKAQCGCSWSGTGFMVSKNRMLTAAHCLVCTRHGKWAKNLTLYFGRTSAKKYVYKYSGKWYAWAGDTFPNKSYRTDWDYACVKLYKNVGDKTGWLKPVWKSKDSELKSTWITVAGYRDGKLKAAAGTVTPIGSNHLGYTIDTQPGSSGGPVFDADYKVYGINIAENNTNNVGYRINSLVKDAYKKSNKK